MKNQVMCLFCSIFWFICLDGVIVSLSLDLYDIILNNFTDGFTLYSSSSVDEWIILTQSATSFICRSKERPRITIETTITNGWIWTTENVNIYQYIYPCCFNSNETATILGHFQQLITWFYELCNDTGHWIMCNDSW